MTNRSLLIALMSVLFALTGTGFAQKQPAAPAPPDKATLALHNAKQMLLLMDADKNGKISKEEWLKFMAAEFDRLDTDKSGELDVKELEKTTISFRHFRFADQGK